MAVDVDQFRTLLEEERQRVVDAIEYLQKENPGTIEDETDDETTDNHLAETATVTLDRSTIRVALVGAGAMGSLHARVVTQSQDTELACWDAASYSSLFSLRLCGARVSN